MKVDKMAYSGYVYIWYDTKAKFFYIGGHYGTIEDDYVCSSKSMKAAYVKRPETFKFKVLQYVNGDTTQLREAEQKWLNLIKDEELYWTPNLYNNTTRYYNQKKIAFGGSAKGHTKNRKAPSHNKGKKMSDEQKAKISESKKGKKFTEEHKANLRKPQIKNPNRPKRIMSDEHKQKIREAHLGRKHSPEHIESRVKSIKETKQRKSGLSRSFLSNSVARP